ncbi:Williams-Beuren syndrome chromosome region 16 protein [Entomortierella chlamydospora]|uniref:Williams-Beuren syndrome chromosome region 16 protein n=1 Tax=Entomortierella chlamydospora TaxID=101097 RepID=A0A9P6MXN2_9FUNG|nr:Williams-Beuren syndrome chromosome region 16 protein [Entomortierella chlamydospora]
MFSVRALVNRSLLRDSALKSSASRCSQFHSSTWFAKASVVEWGYGSEDMTAIESNSIISQGPGRTRIAAGASHRLIALSGGDEAGVLGDGMNHSGQLGSGTRDDEKTFSAIDTTGMEILAVACGREHSMLLAREEKQNNGGSAQSVASSSSSLGKTLLFGFGNSMYGQLGLGGSKDTLGQELAGQAVAGFVFEPLPTEVKLADPSENVVQVECGLDHTVLLTDQGNLYTMGWGADGQLGLGPESSSDRAVPTLVERLSWKAKGKEIGRILEPMHIPHPIPETETIASVAAGGTFGLLLTKTGKVYTCGYGALGLGQDKTQILMPEQITSLSRIREIFASTDYAAAIDDNGDLYTWGTCGNTGRLGHGRFEHCFEPKRVKMPQEQGGRKVVVHDVSLGQDGGLAIIEYDDEK